MHIDYTVNIWREGDQFVAHAMPLDVASAGPEPAAARRAVDEAVRAFAASCAKAGTLDQVLEEAGYVHGEDGAWRSPAWVSVAQGELILAI